MCLHHEPGTVTFADGDVLGKEHKHADGVVVQPGEEMVSARGGKRGGAREHCSQKEMDKTTLGRRIQAKFTALALIFIAPLQVDQ